jgi:hypothetical protein
MSRVNVDYVIGRVLGEDAFRRAFLDAPAASLRHLREAGMELTESECEKLRTTNWTMWMKLVETLRTSSTSGQTVAADPR